MKSSLALRQLSGVFSAEVGYSLLGLISSSLSARLLGPEQRGVVVVAMLVATLVGSFVNIGLPHALNYNLSRSQDRSAGLREALAVCFWTMPAVILTAILATVGTYLYSRKISPTVPSPMFITSVTTLCVGNLLSAVLLRLLIGLHDFRWRNVVYIAPYVGIVFALIFYWAARMPLTPLTLIWAHSIATGAAIIVGSIHLIRTYRPKPPFRTPDHWKREYLGYGLKVHIAGIVMFLNVRLDALIVNGLIGSTSVGLYSAGVTIAELVLFVPTVVNYVFFPRVTAIEDKYRDKMTILTLGMTLYVVVLGSILLTLLLPFIVLALYGRAFMDAVAPAYWLMPGMVPMTVFRVLSHAVSGHGRPEYATYAATVGLVATVALDLLLIPHFGIVGAAVASSVAYTGAAIAILVIFLRTRNIRFDALLRGLITDPIVWIQDRYGDYLRRSIVSPTDQAVGQGAPIMDYRLLRNPAKRDNSGDAALAQVAAPDGRPHEDPLAGAFADKRHDDLAIGDAEG